MKHVPNDQELQVISHIVANYTYGEMIGVDYLYEALEKPNEEMMMTDYKKLDGIYWSRLDVVRDSLLKEHSMLLDNSVGKGYLIVQPSCQTAVSMGKFEKTISSAGKNCVTNLTNIDASQLSQDERAVNANALAAVGRLVQSNSQVSLDFTMTTA